MEDRALIEEILFYWTYDSYTFSSGRVGPGVAKRNDSWCDGEWCEVIRHIDGLTVRVTVYLAGGFYDILIEAPNLRVSTDWTEGNPGEFNSSTKRVSPRPIPLNNSSNWSGDGSRRDAWLFFDVEIDGSGYIVTNTAFRFEPASMEHVEKICASLRGLGVTW